MSLPNVSQDNITSQLVSDQDAAQSIFESTTRMPDPSMGDLYTFQRSITSLSVKSTVMSNFVKALGDICKNIARNIVP